MQSSDSISRASSVDSAAAGSVARAVSGSVSRIEVRSVTRRFGATLALRQVSAAFEAGSLTFLVGPNGAGKGTLLAVVGSVLRPSSG